MIDLLDAKKLHDVEFFNNSLHERIYAIGDIHGCINELKELLVMIWNDLKYNQPVMVKNNFYNKDDDFSHEEGKQGVCIIFLGDYIDRGPSSREVIELVNKVVSDPYRTLLDLANHEDKNQVNNDYMFDAVALSGNHEQMMLYAIKQGRNDDDYSTFRFSDHSACGLWLSNGGRKVVCEYEEYYNSDDFVLPVSHVNFLYNKLRSHTTYIAAGPNNDEMWIFVHAGIHPDQPIDMQLEEDIYWIRNEYISGKLPDKVKVVTGHTPVKSPQFLDDSKLMIDTGCVFGHSLTCAVLETHKPFSEHRFLKVDAKKDYTKLKD